MSNKRVADQIIDFVAKTCSNNVFVLTGNGAMYLNDAIELNPDLNYVCVRNEAAAPLAAASENQLTGKHGVVCVTAGPGSTNAFSGLAEVWVDSGSVLVLSGQVPLEEINNYGHSEVDVRSFGIAGVPITKYTNVITKYSKLITDANEVRNVLKNVYIQLNSGRPGPVWLDIPLNIQSQICVDFSIDELISECKLEIAKDTNLSIDSNNIESINALLENSKRPLILLGRGVDSIENFEEFKSWLIKSKIPFFTSRVTAHKFPISIENNFGVLGVRGRPWSSTLLKKSDLILSLGSRFPSSIVGPNYAYLDKEVQLISVDIDINEIKRHGSKISLGINKSLAKITSLLNGFNLELINKNIESWKTEIQKVKSNFLAQSHSQAAESPLNLYWFMSELEKYADPKTVLTTDAGSNYYAAGQAMNFEKLNYEVTSGTFAAMGLSLPLAIGASVAIKNKGGQVFCVTGDGSIELNIQELQTLSTYGLNVKVFVINNGGYASMRTWQETYFDGRYIGSTDDTGTKPLDFSKISKAFNLDYEVIQDSKDFHDKIPLIVGTSQPMLIEVMCDSNQQLLLPMETDLV